MKNCLVTKLKGVVDNDNLEKLGELKFWFLPNSANTDISLGAVSANTSFLTTKNTSDFANFPIKVGAKPEAISVPLTFSTLNVEQECVVSDKYNLAMFNVNTNLKDFDINSLLYCVNLKWICLLNNDATVTGDVKDFLTKYAKITNSTELTFIATGLTNIPRGISSVWNIYSKVFFNASYKNGWYVYDGQETYYDCDGNVITP